MVVRSGLDRDHKTGGLPSGDRTRTLKNRNFAREENEVKSSIARRVAFLASMVLGMLAVASPAWAETLTVTNKDDSGTGSLRAAVATANTNSEADTITFDLPEGENTITLTTDQISFTESQKTTVDGGAGGVTVSGGDATRVFYVDSGGNLSTKRLTISDGSAPTAQGGGIFNRGGVLSIIDSTVSGNSSRWGGGVASLTSLSGMGGTTIENSTISGNTASHIGGGVYNIEGLVTISNSTITNNTAPEDRGAGVASYGKTDTSTVVGSSIIAANPNTDVDFLAEYGHNSFSSDGHNVVGDGNATANLDGTGDQTGVADPRLRPLADNGGSTKTHELLEGSPAIDEGATSLTTDQRGKLRPFDDPDVMNATGGDGSDVGSFEVRQFPDLSVADVRLTEGTGGTADAVFSFRLSGFYDQPVNVDYATAEDTATSPADYTSRSGTLTITPGQTRAEVRVPVSGDALDENAEDFFLTLSNAGNAVLAGGAAKATILDDDDLPSLSVDDVTIAERDSGTTSARFTVSLSAPSGRTVGVDHATADGTATAPSDYAAMDGTLAFPAGATTRTVTVPVSGDATDETDEEFSVVLSLQQNAALADDTGTATIIDDDGPPTAPEISGLSPAPGSKIRNRTPTIGATVSDSNTNLVKDKIRLWVDGRRAERFPYDRATDRLSYTASKLDLGRHTVLIVARDGEGLSARRSWAFAVRR